MKTTSATTLQRTSYGELAINHQTTTTEDQNLISSARNLIFAAEKTKKIPAAYDDMQWGRSGKEKGKRIGDALYHEIYDITLDGRAVLVCCRSVSGDRYGQKTTGKEYFIVRRYGDGVRVAEAKKSVAAKAAKSAAQTLGVAIAVCTGKEKLKVPALQVRTGYKAVAFVDGEMRSIFSGEIYKMAIRKAESVGDGHGGGFYFYGTAEEALRAEVPECSKLRDAKRIIVRCEVSGREIRYGKKIAASFIRPLEIIASVI